jgi:hypothetical protein
MRHRIPNFKCFFLNKVDERGLECDIRRRDEWIWYRNVKERDHFKEPTVDGMSNIKMDLKKSRMELYRQNSSSTRGWISWTWKQLNHSIQPFNPIQVPLLNTAILLASGVTVTWAHHGLLENNTTQATQGLFFTVLLGRELDLIGHYQLIKKKLQT